MQQVMNASAIVGPNFKGESSLHKDTHANRYLLVLSQDNCSKEDFIRVCNILSEYGNAKKLTVSGTGYLTEHMEILVAENALQLLSGK